MGPHFWRSWARVVVLGRQSRLLQSHVADIQEACASGADQLSHLRLGKAVRWHSLQYRSLRNWASVFVAVLQPKRPTADVVLVRLDHACSWLVRDGDDLPDMGRSERQRRGGLFSREQR